MAAKSTRFQRFLRELVPVFYGVVAAVVATGGLVVAILLYEQQPALANPPPQLQASMLSGSKQSPSSPQMLVDPAETIRPALPANGTPAARSKPAPPKEPVAEVPPVKPQPPVPFDPPGATLSVGSGKEKREWVPFRDDMSTVFRQDKSDIGHTPLLLYAVMLDDAEWIGQLIVGGVDPNELTPAGDTMLCHAVRISALNSVRALVYGGADVTKPGLEKQVPLALASLRRGADIYRALLSAGADANTRFNSPVTRELLDRVTIKDLKNALEEDRGVTPLIACAARGDVEGAAELMRWGASASRCTTRYHRYPINFAANQGYLFLMRIILGRQPESEPQVLVTVDLSRQRAWVTMEGRIIDTCPVSTGREGYKTPAGRYVITDKHRSWTSTLYHVAMPFFMRLNCGAIGLHSGYVTGRPASHGCIRLPYDKAKKFFSLCEVGDEVQIVY